jgi:cellulose synthase/poly-beta-1,6-N-acetylglucosamine synthase-like glycosyltransferase
MNHLLPSISARARKESLIGIILLAVSMSAFALFFIQNYLNSRGVLSRFIPGTGAERVVYNAIFLIFMYGSFAYQVSRLTFFLNIRKQTRAAERNYKRFIGKRASSAPRVEVLVPSYKEESHVIWQTLMSAALMTYPNRGIVLLLDDPPYPVNSDDRQLLLSARAQVDLIAALLEPIAARFLAAANWFRMADPRNINLENAATEAAQLYDEAAALLEGLADQVGHGAFGGPDDHTRKFFVERILHEPARDYRHRAVRLRQGPQDFATLNADFDRLSHMFHVRLSIFERKKYANLSHAPTKAANLNSYLSVMGRRLQVVPRPGGLSELVDCTPGAVSDLDGLEPADAKYVIILDADSFLLADYATCMVSALESPENAGAAVVQTPYTAVPGSPSILERTAGATTDIYYFVTEGMGFANAGFWVGASATIRKEALLSIATEQEERGYRFPGYIQDTTVIEDTGATIDLARRGWTVQNYPARLSYSATPADFGALVVQRRRWANGGVIILPALLRHILSVPFTFRRLLEAALRIHYLVMPACLCASMLLMLIYPFDFKRVSSWIYLTLPPYLYLICRDLAHAGYRRAEILRAYTLFVLLLPVVFAGVKNSMYQIVFGVKAEFGRTPKVDRRTAVPLSCIAALIALFGWSAAIAYADLTRGDRVHAVFAISNFLALGYGMCAMIGLKAIFADVAAALSSAASTLCAPLLRLELAPRRLPKTFSPVVLAGRMNFPPISAEAPRMVRSEVLVTPRARRTARLSNEFPKERTYARGR